MHKNYKIIFFVLACFALFFPLFSQKSSLPPALTKAIQEGKTAKANELAAEIVFSAEDATTGVRANVVMSILLFLEADSEASSRAQSIGDFYLDTKNAEEKRALHVLKYLAGKSSEEKFIATMKKEPVDWQATAAISRYVKILTEEGVNAKKLNTCVKEYMEISEKLGKNSWGNVWKTRLIRWHNSLQDKMDKGDGLEKLIGEIKDDVLAGPLKGQLKAIDKIIELLLNDRKKDAFSACRKYHGEIDNKDSDVNRPYVAILDYLGGKKFSMQDVYKTSKANPDLFLMAGVSLFIKTLSNADSGNIKKASLIVHLKNFSNNISNTEKKSILAWKKNVDKWKQWCNEDFPVKRGQKPLLARHSRAFAEKHKEKLALKNGLRVFEKISSARSLNSVSLNEYKQVRALFKNRPTPDDMDFSGPEIKKYLNSLPLETQQGEWARIRYLKTFPENMSGMLNVTKYSGSIKLKSKSVRGQIVTSDAKSVTIKSRSKSRKYKWGDLKPEQFIIISQDYIKKHIGGKVKGRDNIFITGESLDKSLAKHYRLMAIYFDWYGLYPEALKYGKMASKYQSYDKGSTRQLLLH